MVCQDHHDKLVSGFHKTETQRQPGPALEDVAFQLSNTQPAVDVRIAKRLAQLKQREHDSDFFRVGAGAQLLLHGRV